jgi:seryl-tRNA synthetase
MIDLQRVIQNPDEFTKNLENRNFHDKSIFQKLKEVSENKKKLQQEAESLRSERNKVSKEIGILKSKGESTDIQSSEMKKVGERIKEIEDTLLNYETQLEELLVGLPNFLDSTVPVGKDEHQNVLVREFGKKREFDFTPIPHFELGEKMKILDFERGVKLSGARFYTYFGLAAKLERALMNFMLELHSENHGYQEVWVPAIVNDESMTATGQLPKFREEFYQIEKDGLNLIPTAEVPVTNLYRNEILNEKDLPISLVAHTSCFRREAGSYGKDTRGLVRVHQFQKVELVKFVHPDKSDEEHESLLSHAENVLKELDLHYRVMLLCSGDTSASSSKTYDLEVWMPGLNRYMEISSVSNFRDYQSRRGKIRFKSKEGKNLLVHTLNGSGLAIGRTLAAIMENYQTKDNGLEIPTVLKSYLKL